MKDRNIVFALESERLKNIRIHDRPAARALWASSAPRATRRKPPASSPASAVRSRGCIPRSKACGARRLGRLDRLLQSRRLHLLRPRAGRERSGLGGGGFRLHDGAEPLSRKGQRPSHPDRRRLHGLLGRRLRRQSREGGGGHVRRSPRRRRGRRERRSQESRGDTKGRSARGGRRQFQARPAGRRALLRARARAERGAAFGALLYRGRIRGRRRALSTRSRANANRAAAERRRPSIGGCWSKRRRRAKSENVPPNSPASGCARS